MLKDLETLIELQAIDIRIHQEQQSKCEYPQTITQLEKDMENLKSVHSAAVKKHEETAALKQANVDRIAELEAALSKSQERINSIQNNREYEAVHSEIEHNRHALETAKHQINKLKDDAANSGQAVEKAQEELTALETVNNPQIAELKEKLATIDSRIAEITLERNKITPLISKNILRTYDHIRARRKNGQALSILSGASRTCTSCHKILEIQLVNEVHKNSKMILCNSCESILLWKELA